MKQFVFAFPLLSSLEEVPSFLEKVQIKGTEGSIMVPGCSIPLEIFIRGSVSSLVEIFEEHSPLSPEEKNSLQQHRSLFFIRGTLRDNASLEETNGLIKKIIEAGALGIYAEHSGAAYSAKSFLEFDLEEDPMDFWLNFIESKGGVFTLGLESFMLPDLSINALHGNPEELRDLLITTAEYLYTERIPADSGTKVEIEERKVYELCKESSPLFSKNDPEFNRLGTMRLVER